MQIALQSPPLGIAGLCDPRPRALHLHQHQSQLDPQPSQLDRHRRRVEHAVQKIRLAGEPRIVQQQPQQALPAPDRRHAAAVVPGRLDQIAEAIRVALGLGQREQHLGS
jgi:hypothetical protein